jgi:hypothetical protein
LPPRNAFVDQKRQDSSKKKGKKKNKELRDNFSHDVTVKASNLGPHGNSGPLFQKGLLSLKRILQKKMKIKTCRKTLDLQICFCSYFVHDSSKEATELAKKGPKIQWGPKLGAFTVTSPSSYRQSL